MGIMGLLVDNKPGNKFKVFELAKGFVLYGK